MKEFNRIAIMGILICLLSSFSYAGDLSPAEKKLIDAEVKKIYKVTNSSSKINLVAYERVTAATIYDVKVIIKGPDGSSSSSPMKLIKHNNKITSLTYPSTNQPCPELKALIKKSFKLKTAKDAKMLEGFLDQLYPISDSFGGKDKEAKAIKKSGNKIILIRGEFFKKFKGFIFETDASGSVIKVDYSLGIKP
jgi:hypothetical protein